VSYSTPVTLESNPHRCGYTRNYFNMWNSFITRVPIILPHLALIVVNDRFRYDRIRTVPSPPRPGAATPYALIELQYRRDPESSLREVQFSFDRLDCRWPCSQIAPLLGGHELEVGRSPVVFRVTVHRYGGSRFPYKLAQRKLRSHSSAIEICTILDSSTPTVELVEVFQTWYASATTAELSASVRGTSEIQHGRLGRHNAGTLSLFPPLLVYAGTFCAFSVGCHGRHSRQSLGFGYHRLDRCICCPFT